MRINIRTTPSGNCSYYITPSGLFRMRKLFTFASPLPTALRTFLAIWKASTNHNPVPDNTPGARLAA